MITFDRIKVDFGDFTAIPDFTLTVNEGEFFTFLGPSGCGKSTALRALAGFVTPSQGRLLVGDREVTTLPSDQRGIGMVFQNYALFPSLSVAENIAFGLKVAKTPRAKVRERVDQIARAVELTSDQLAKGVAELSGGQQQRVAIARALVMRPRILLLDEPLSNLDAKLRKQLRGQLKDLQQQFGITTIYVTHDQDEALSMSDRIAVLNAGVIEQVGTPQAIYEASATEFVCTFIGSVNQLNAGICQLLTERAPSRIDPNRNSYVRTERISLSSVEASAAELISFPGVVESSTYHGASTNYVIRVEDQLIRASVGYRPNSPTWAIGDQVHIQIAPQDVLQYEKTSEQAPA